MKRNAPMHPKVGMLASMLGVRRFEAVGILEMLWHFTAQYCPAGDIGKRTDAQIAAFIDWPVDQAERLKTALVDCGWLDSHPEHRLIVHDWHEHSDGTCDRYLAMHKMNYAQGRAPRKQFADSDAKLRASARTCAQVRDNARLSRARAGPEPEPEPEPSPLTPRGGLGGCFDALKKTGKLPCMTWDAFSLWIHNAGADLATEEQLRRVVVQVSSIPGVIVRPDTQMTGIIQEVLHPKKEKSAAVDDNAYVGENGKSEFVRRMA